MHSCTESHDPEIINFIDDQEEYVKLTDFEKLPKKVSKYYDVIIDFMEIRNMETEEYFVWLSYIEDSDSIIKIPICHYDGFVRKYNDKIEFDKIEADQSKLEVDTSINDGGYFLHTGIKGNASGGKDGNLLIDKVTSSVLEFGIWR